MSAVVDSALNELLQALEADPATAAAMHSVAIVAAARECAIGNRMPLALALAELGQTLVANTETDNLPGVVKSLHAIAGDSGGADLQRALRIAADLRALRGEKVLFDASTFAPQLTAGDDSGQPLPVADDNVARLPRLFSAAVAQLADAATRPKAFKYLGNIALQLRQFSKHTAAAPLWGGALALVEAAMKHGDAPDPAVGLILDRLQERAARLVAGDGAADHDDLLRDMLFYVATGGVASGHTSRVREQYALDAAFADVDDAALESVVESILAPLEAAQQVAATDEAPPPPVEGAEHPESIAEPAAPAASGDSADDAAEPDPVIVEIFLEEAEELVESIDTVLDRWVSGEDAAALDELQRHMHTIKGGARMASQAALGDLSHDAENFVADVTAARQSPEEAGPRLRYYRDAVRAGVQALAAGENVAAAIATVAAPGAVDTAAVPSEAPPAAEIAADSADAGAVPRVDEAVPAAADPEPASQLETDEVPEQPAAEPGLESVVAGDEENADPVIVEIFLEEADELLENLDASLTEWQSTGSEDVLGEIQRQMHTVKGGARMASQTALGNVAHDAETFSLEALNRGDSAEQVAPRLRLYIDKLSAGINALKTGENVAAAINFVADGGTAAVAPAAASPVSPAPVVPADAESPSAPVREPVESSPAASKKTAAAKAPAQEETLRVPATLLDALTNLSSEGGVARNRVGQQLATLASVGEEMGHSIDRLREAVRAVEGEVEVLQNSIAESGDDNPELQRQLLDSRQLALKLREAAEDMRQLRKQLLDSTAEAEQQQEQQTRIDQELQAGLLRARTVPFSRSEARLHRIVRQVSNELGKPVQLQLQNAEGELDRRMLERIIAPLEHMLRNAVDHGIEDVEKRRAAGKPEQGTVKVAFDREGGEIVISISDDGGGIKVDAVRNKAIEQGLLEADAELDDRQVLQYLLKPGFSTATAVTQISGRGVGMDVVNSEIVQLGGNLEVATRPGEGSTFMMRLPFTLSSNKVLMVRLESNYYAVAMHMLDAVVPVSPTELAHQYNQVRPIIERGGTEYALYYLGDLVASQAPPYLDGRSDQVQVLLMSDGTQDIALHVDAVENAAELTVKTLGSAFAQVPGLVGASVRGDGNVAVILDVFALLSRFEATSGQRTTAGLSLDSLAADLAVTVLLVDDALSARTATAAMLRDHGLQVVEKRDGVEAMDWLQSTARLPQLLITEIALPRMDGFELLDQVGRDERCKGMPLMVISRLLDDASRDRARSHGAGSYMTKPANTEAVLKAISQMTGAVIQGLDGG